LFTSMNTAMMKYVAISLTGTAMLFTWLALIVFVAVVPHNLKDYVQAILKKESVTIDNNDIGGYLSIGWAVVSFPEQVRREEVYAHGITSNRFVQRLGGETLRIGIWLNQFGCD